MLSVKDVVRTFISEYLVVFQQYNVSQLEFTANLITVNLTALVLFGGNLGPTGR
jgi:hypothetical protein